MPIEFSCTQCGKQLRTPDETAGRNAKCPQCGTIMKIPQPGAFAPLPSAAPAESPFPPAASPAPQSQAPGDEFNFNPYQSPTATTGYPMGMQQQASAPLASLGARLGGAILDWVFYVIGAIPGGIYMVMDAASRDGAPPQPGREAEMIASMAGSLAIMYGGMLIVAVINWIMVSQSGQSLGKKIVGTRIVRLDGSLPGFAYGVAMRSWIPGIIGMIPWIGGLFGLVDTLFIFGQERRCIHDQIAGTRVVVA